jgi:hypothetical protein
MATAFTSWKEIAQYLGKGVRTAQRWEREAGLPIRRQHGHGGGKVLAFADEIDAWKHSATLSGDQSERMRLLARVDQLLAENEDLQNQLNAIRQDSGGLSVLNGFNESLVLRCTQLLTDSARNRRILRDLIETQSSLTETCADIIEAVKAFIPFRPDVPSSSRSTK